MVCTRCLLDSDKISDLVLDANGVCNFCKIHDDLEAKNPVDRNRFYKIVRSIKSAGRGKPYDCIVGMSGGCDSSYLMELCLASGLRPLAVHWTNGWDTETAIRNISVLSESLGFDLECVGVDREEYDDICRSFLLASVCDADIPNDIALTTVMLQVARKHNVHYILDAHDFRTEGTTPLSWSYMDGGYILSVQDKFGRKPLCTFPNLWFDLWMDFLTNFPVQRPRLLYSVRYDKEAVKRRLHEKYGWNWYGGHHCENKYTIFVGNYLHPQKFGIDLRWIEMSALVRSGWISKEEAIKRLESPPEISPSILREVESRLEVDLGEILKIPKKTHSDYDTYENLFHSMAPTFKRFHEKGLIPSTFYMKYVLRGST